jgi:uncharacterized Tic20 family protein
MLSDELDRLNQLRMQGALSEEEFQQAKQQLLGGAAGGAMPNQIAGIRDSTFLMLMHLSQLLTFAGGVGIAVPIVMWAVGKDDSREVNRHGLMIINWFISVLIYSIISGLLCFVLIGFPMLVVLAIVTVVFPILGAIKANSGEYWRYPLTIDFFDTSDLA